jgi:phosphatidate cytidylyltransferase
MLKTRVVTALALLAGFLAMLFLLPFSGWLLFASCVAGAGAWEWGGLLKLSGIRRGTYAGAAFLLCALLGWGIFDVGTGQTLDVPLLIVLLTLAGLFWLLAVPAWLIRKWSIAASPAGLVAGWVVLIPACLALMQLRVASPLLLLAVMAFVWLADIAAYFSGRAFGKHKLAPQISPGKTWEGAAGAAVALVVYCLIVASAASLVPSSPAILLGALVLLECLLAVSILGDLFESLAKRQAGVKDSGSLLPGHGGVLDRIDSLTSALPMCGLALLAWEGRLV